MFQARLANSLLCALAVLVGLHFTFIGGLEMMDFLAFAYVYVPTLFIAIAIILIPWDRHTRVMDLVLTSPFPKSAYYWSRFMGVVMLGVVYVVITVPFAGLVVWFSGWKWIPVLAHHMALALVIVVVAASLGLLLGLLFRRAVIPAVFTGFGVAFVLLAWPLIMGALRQHVDPALQSSVMRLLVLSPAFAAANASPLFRTVGGPTPVGLIVAALALAGVLAVTGWLVFTRLQDCNTWRSRPRGAVLIVLVVLLGVGGVVTSLPGVEYTGLSPTFHHDPVPVGGQGVGVIPVRTFDDEGRVAIREEFRNPVTLRVTHPGNTEASIILHDVTIRFRSDDFRFTPATHAFGSVEVPAGEEGHVDLTPEVHVIVTGSNAPYGGNGMFEYTFTAEDLTATGLSVVNVAPPVAAPYAYPIGVTVLLGLGVRSLTLIRRRAW
jgi:hypothetical protein